MSSLKSRINHSGKLTILFFHFAYPTGVFQRLEQFTGYYFFEVGTNKGVVYFAFRQIKSDIPEVYKSRNCNQMCLKYLNKPDSDICSSDALTAATTKLLFSQWVANTGDMKLYILFMIIRKSKSSK